MTTEKQTQAVFTRLTAADLKTLRAIAKRKGTTSSMIIRELTEAYVKRERDKQRRERDAARQLRQHEAATA